VDAGSDSKRTAIAGANFATHTAPFWERSVLSLAAYISTNASQYFFLCGELLKDRRMVLRNRLISVSSMGVSMPH
jgi:hypothetical protein